MLFNERISRRDFRRCLKPSAGDKVYIVLRHLATEDSCTCPLPLREVCRGERPADDECDDNVDIDDDVDNHCNDDDNDVIIGLPLP
eukprot:gene3792-biopygen736